MLCNGGELNGARVVGRKTLELMHSNWIPSALLPYDIGGMPSPGWGFGLGSRVMMNPAETGGPGSVGEFGWAGAAKTYYWVDPVEKLVVVYLTQLNPAGDVDDFARLRALVYQAIVD